MRTFLFACVQNAGRSQMAAAFFRELADPSKARAISAGTQPGDRVHPVVVQAMSEVGIRLEGAKPQKLTPELAQGVEMLITMGCGDDCPFVPGLRREDWPLPDPKGLPIEQVRAVRDQIRQRVREFVETEQLGKANIAIRPAIAAEEAAVSNLLLTAGLVALDPTAQFGPQYAVAVAGDGVLVGVAGMERHGSNGLLRSVAVAKEMQRQRIGKLLTSDRLRWAEEHGLHSVFLLTTTARDYWKQFGFTEIDRAAAPPEIQGSHEWSSACPATATAMVKSLRLKA